MIWDEKLIVLKTLPVPDHPESLPDWGTSLLNALRALSPEIACCGIGSIVNSVSAYEASYQQARYCLTACQSSHPLRIISDRSLLVGYTLVESMSNPVIAALAPISQKFRHFLEKKSEARKTMETLLASNLNLSNAAKALHIHRNTLMFRLEQLRTTVGLDPAHNFEDAVLCRILLEQTMQKENRHS